MRSVVFVACLAACSARSPASGPTTPRTIQHARAQWNAALLRRDSVALADLVDDSAVHISPRFVHVGRREFLQVFTSNMMQRPQFALTYVPERVTVCENQCTVGTEYGHWTESWLEQDEPTEVGGTYYTVWRRYGVEWKIVRELFATQFCRGRRYCDR
jgi:ketosteroid isomerase-like protein